MKTSKLIFIIPCALVMLSSCTNKQFLKLMQEHEEGVHNPTSIEELEDAISKYERRVEDIMLAQNRIAIWYKMLGTRYMENKMYTKALECFSNALEYYPDNHNLYYQVGLCAANVGKNFVGDIANTGKSKAYYFGIAENAYDVALRLQPSYTKAAYAEGVLCVYELGKPEKAIAVLKPVVERESKNYDALFVLGAAYYLNGEKNLAINVYKKIAQNATDKTIVENAKKNILQIEAE